MNRQASPPEVAVRHLACPRCRTPMQALSLSSHRQQAIQVEHCADCRLVWFDELESVQLDASGWVRLLRTMEAGARRPLAQAAVARPACPSCAVPLKTVQNRTRFGLFSALECPQRHGHLHSHSGLLAERGLVRPLGLTERRALAKQQQRLACFNCGALASSTDDNCSYCATPLVVLDLPRLAHSLRLRADAMAASPQAAGRHVAWACRGCGAALDPGRETSCSHCGHLVLALELPDVDPLLEEAEAALAAAAASDAQRRERFASTRRAPARASGAIPRAETRRRGTASAGSQRLMLAGWLPLLTLLALAVTVAVLIIAGLHWPPQTPAQVLRDQRVGDDPGAAWAWVEAQRLVQAEDRAKLTALRRGLFDLYARQIAGEPWPAQATVGSVIDGEAVAPQFDRLRRGLDRHLQPLSPAGEVPLPPGAGGLQGRLAAAAPGVWVDFDTRRDSLWSLWVANTGPAPLEVSDLSVRIRVSRIDGVPWNCEPASAASPVLRPGKRLHLVCRGRVAVFDQEALWGAAMQALRAGELPTLEWTQDSRGRQGGVERIIDRLVTDAAPGSARLDRFLRRHTDLRRDTAEVADAAGLKQEPALSMRERWDRISAPRRQVLWVMLGICAWVGFCAIARWRGERRAAVITLLVAVVPSVLLGGGQGPASVLLVAMYLALSVLMIAGFTYAWRWYRDLVFRRFD